MNIIENSSSQCANDHRKLRIRTIALIFGKFIVILYFSSKIIPWFLLANIIFLFFWSFFRYFVFTLCKRSRAVHLWYLRTCGRDTLFYTHTHTQIITHTFTLILTLSNYSHTMHSTRTPSLIPTTAVAKLQLKASFESRFAFQHCSFPLCSRAFSRSCLASQLKSSL